MTGIAVKTPLPFLTLCIVGVVPLVGLARQGKWTALAPAVCALAILIVTMPVKYDAGVRHVLGVFPLLAVVGGCGASYLGQRPGESPTLRTIYIGGPVVMAIGFEPQRWHRFYFLFQ